MGETHRTVDGQIPTPKWCRELWISYLSTNRVFKFLTFFNHSNGRILATVYKSYQKRCVTGGGCKTSAHAEGQRSGCCQTHASSSRTGRAERHEKSPRSDLDFASKSLLGHITFATFVHTPMTFCWSFLLGFDSSAADETSCTFLCWCVFGVMKIPNWKQYLIDITNRALWSHRYLDCYISSGISLFAAWNRPSIFHSPVVPGWAKAPSFGARDPWKPRGRSNEKESKGNEGAGHHHETPSQSSKVLGTTWLPFGWVFVCSFDSFAFHWIFVFLILRNAVWRLRVHIDAEKCAVL